MYYLVHKWPIYTTIFTSDTINPYIYTRLWSILNGYILNIRESDPGRVVKSCIPLNLWIIVNDLGYGSCWYVFVHICTTKTLTVVCFRPVCASCHQKSALRKVKSRGKVWERCPSPMRVKTALNKNRKIFWCVWTMGHSHLPWKLWYFSVKILCFGAFWVFFKVAITGKGLYRPSEGRIRGARGLSKQHEELNTNPHQLAPCFSADSGACHAWGWQKSGKLSPWSRSTVIGERRNSNGMRIKCEVL